MSDSALGHLEYVSAAFNGENATRYSKFLWLTASLYLTSGIVSLVPENRIGDSFVLVWFIAFLVCWVPFPYWLYKDRQRTASETDYTPSKAYYVGWFPGYLGVLAIGVYLYYRGKAYAKVDEDNENMFDRDFSNDSTEHGDTFDTVTNESESGIEYWGQK